MAVLRGRSVHALQSNSFGAPAGNSGNPDHRTICAKHRYDGIAVKTGHPGRICTATLRFVRAALPCLSYRALIRGVAPWATLLQAYSALYERAPARDTKRRNWGRTDISMRLSDELQVQLKISVRPQLSRIGESSEYRPRNLPGKNRVLCLLSYRLVGSKGRIRTGAKWLMKPLATPVPYCGADSGVPTRVPALATPDSCC